MNSKLLCTLAMSLAGFSATTSPARAGTPAEYVNYEQFGAVGDGITDDLPAIVKAHAHANERGLPVRSNPEATYHLGRRALTAIIQTDTDWSTSRFIIDDSQGVEDHQQSLFHVRSRLAPVPLKIDHLSIGQARLDHRPATELLVLVENKNRRLFIRRGLNANRGTPQREAFILKQDGVIEGAIEWEYETVTSVEARPIDPEPLTLRGGLFINIGNRMKQPEGYNYWARNIHLTRSNTVVDGVTSEVVGETDFGHPYSGFLNVAKAANITFRNCRIDPRKVYQTIGNAQLPVSMGTYGYRADLVVNFSLLHCRMGDIHDTSRWGVATSNFMKNVLVEDCVLSRMDVHQGVSGYYIIRRSTLGHAGLKAIGRGRLVLEDSTVYAENLVTFRPDYGATWDGEVLVRNSRWIPPYREGRPPAMFSVNNDGTHDFGYSCSMPRLIQIDGLLVDDSAQRGDFKGVTFFDSPRGAPTQNPPFPYRPTERLVVRGLKTTSGLLPRVSNNAAVTKAIEMVWKPEAAGDEFTPGGRVPELPSAAGAAASAPVFVTLFNGKDFANFNETDDVRSFWRIEEDVLVGENNADKKGHSLWTKKDYSDFVMEFDVRWQSTTPRGIDTGIEMRKPRIQLQLGVSGSLKVDMTGSFYTGGRPAYPEAGQAKEAKRRMKPEGEWNTIRIQAKGNTFTCWINGAQASEYTDDKFSGAAPVGLQIHAGVVMKVEYRNLRIAEL